jgi:ubiquinone/menaquinone biosynthesis C-methylase UbiE
MPFDHFDLISGIYNRTAKFQVSGRLMELLALPVDGLILDIGGGTGRVSESLLNQVSGAIVADPSRGMLHFSIERGIAAICTPAETLPFAACVFDRIIMVDALHHVSNQHQTIDELWRVLAVGGRITIVEPDIHRFSVKLIAIGEKMLFMRSHFLSSDRIAALFPQDHIRIQIIEDEINVLVCAEKVKGL